MSKKRRDFHALFPLDNLNMGRSVSCEKRRDAFVCAARLRKGQMPG
jgi:hypothetical protein